MKKVGFILASLLAFVVSTSLCAEEAKLYKWYGGIGFGGGEHDLTLSDFDDGSLQSGDVTTEEPTTKFFIGYPLRFKNLPFNVLVEGGYIDLPRAKFEGVTDGSGTGFKSPVNDARYFVNHPTAPVGPVSGNGEVDGITAAGILDYPIWRDFHVQGKLGLFLWDSEMTLTNLTLTNSQTGLPQVLDVLTQSDDGIDVFFGLGFEYSFLKRFAVRAEYEQYRISYRFVGDTTYDIYTASFLVRF